MELRHLRYFVAVVEEGSFTTAVWARTEHLNTRAEVSDGKCLYEMFKPSASEAGQVIRHTVKLPAVKYRASAFTPAFAIAGVHQNACN